MKRENSQTRLKFLPQNLDPSRETANEVIKMGGDEGNQGRRRLPRSAKVTKVREMERQ